MLPNSGAFDKREVLQVRVEVDGAENLVFSRLSTVVGDIFAHFIPQEHLGDFQFIDEIEIKNDGENDDWVSSFFSPLFSFSLIY
jgi:hypothetical protein